MNTPAKLVLLTVAGASAFYGAAQWSGQGAFGASAEEAEVVGAVTRPPTRAIEPSAAPVPGPAAAISASAAASTAPRRIPSVGGAAFATLSWLPPPAPPPPAPPPAAAAAPAPPPRPVAPPLPFTFVGMAERGADRPQAYLAKGDALLVVAVGDVIDNNTYRVDAMATTGVVLTYLPLNKQQTVNVPGGPP
jgi:hypothetical protein